MPPYTELLDAYTRCATAWAARWITPSGAVAATKAGVVVIVEVVEAHHTLAPRQQGFRHRGTDESRCPGHQDRVAAQHSSSSRRFLK